MPTHKQSIEELEQTAATWVFRGDEGLSAAEREEFERWLAQDPQHAEAVARFERAWSALDGPRAAGSCEVIEGRLASRARRRRRVRATMAVAAIATVCLTSLHFLRLGPTAPTAEVAVVLPESRVLADGSVVLLKSGASVTVDFSEFRRGIRLDQGEAYFDVAPESRPFVVSAGEVEFRAVGTAFAVVRASEHVELLVSEGRVAVAVVTESEVGREPSAEGSARADAVATVVDAGSRVVVALRDADGRYLPTMVTSVPSPEIAERLSWRVARLEFTDIHLSKAIKVINEHSPSRLRIGDRELEDILVSGYFRADQTEGFVRLLEANFDVRTEVQGADIVLRRRH